MENALNTLTPRVNLLGLAEVPAHVTLVMQKLMTRVFVCQLIHASMRLACVPPKQLASTLDQENTLVCVTEATQAMACCVRMAVPFCHGTASMEASFLRVRIFSLVANRANAITASFHGLVWCVTNAPSHDASTAAF